MFLRLRGADETKVVAPAFPYIPLDARGWRLAMGLRPLEVSRWLEIDHLRSEELALKQELLAHRRDVVVATIPEGDPASYELLAEVLEWLCRYAPWLKVTPSPGEHPIVAAALVVQEDLCVLVRSDDWRLAAACVCFPSRWLLASKIGRTIDEIHQPVPGYGEHLAGPTNSVLDRLSENKPYWRLNWTLIDDATLHQPTSERRAPHGDLDQWFFRVERQSIRRLSESGAIVFTIHNYVASVAELSDTPEFIEHLLMGLEGSSPATQEYKGWIGVAERLREALA